MTKLRRSSRRKKANNSNIGLNETWSKNSWRVQPLQWFGSKLKAGMAYQDPETGKTKHVTSHYARLVRDEVTRRVLEQKIENYQKSLLNINKKGEDKVVKNKKK